MNEKDIRKSDGFLNEKLIVIPRKYLSSVKAHPLISPLYITDIGMFPHAQYHYRERASGCDQNILILCTGGEGWVDIYGGRVEVKPHMLVIIPKNTPHSYGSSPEDPWHIYWVHFDGYNAPNFFKAVSPGKITVLSVPEEKLSYLLSLFDSIYEAMEKGYFTDNIICTSHAFAYFLSIIFSLQRTSAAFTPRQVKYVEDAIKFMQDNIEKNLTLDTLAHALNLSKNHIINLFKSKTGSSPIDYFTRLKMQKACQLLDLTDMSIAETAARMGFNDPYYFSRVFKKVMDISPSQYRKIKKG